MKATALIVLIAMAFCGCVSEETRREATATTRCWLSEIEGPDFGNVLSICTQSGVATLSNHFKNPGGIPTTCDSDGVSRSPAKGEMSFSFEPGTCENGRKSGAMQLGCRTNRDRSLSCQFIPEVNLLGFYSFKRVDIDAS